MLGLVQSGNTGNASILVYYYLCDWTYYDLTNKQRGKNSKVCQNNSIVFLINGKITPYGLHYC